MWFINLLHRNKIAFCPSLFSFLLFSHCEKPEATMSRQLDNSNPTIFAPAHTKQRTRQPKSTKALLWGDNDDEYEAEGSGSGSDEVEEIDSEEVYGQYMVFPHSLEIIY